jgi:hypothetical protein
MPHWWSHELVDRSQAKEIRPEVPGRRRSRYSNRRASKPAKIFTAHGRITGYELADGTVVKLKDCCENPYACEREECWAPWPSPKAPWWRR